MSGILFPIEKAGRQDKYITLKETKYLHKAQFYMRHETDIFKYPLTQPNLLKSFVKFVNSPFKIIKR